MESQTKIHYNLKVKSFNNEGSSMKDFEILHFYGTKTFKVKVKADNNVFTLKMIKLYKADSETAVDEGELIRLVRDCREMARFNSN